MMWDDKMSIVRIVEYPSIQYCLSVSQDCIYVQWRHVALSTWYKKVFWTPQPRFTVPVRACMCSSPHPSIPCHIRVWFKETMAAWLGTSFTGGQDDAASCSSLAHVKWDDQVSWKSQQKLMLPVSFHHSGWKIIHELMCDEVMYGKNMQGVRHLWECYLSEICMLSSGDNSLECLNILAMIHSPCSCSMHLLVDPPLAPALPFPVYVLGHIYSVVGSNLRLTARNLIQIRCSRPVSMDIVGRLCRFYGAGQVLRQGWRARRYKLVGWGNQSSRDLASPGRLSAAYSSRRLTSDKLSPWTKDLFKTVFPSKCLSPWRQEAQTRDEFFWLPRSIRQRLCEEVQYLNFLP